MLHRLDLRGVADLTGRLPRPAPAGAEPVAAVEAILAEVAQHGDEALRDLTERFDGVRVDDLRVPAAEIDAALAAQPPALRDAIDAAAAGMDDFHRSQLHGDHRYERDGIVVEGRTVPVDRAGCYVPGGRALYPSTVLMTAVPARVAGVPEVVLCVPPDGTGHVPQVTLAAAAVAGVDEVYRVGGAQAIGALAYGTASIRPVDVVVGPGNVFVAVAKRLVAGEGRVGVPSAFAGPSEVVVIADGTVDADLVAVDVILQAEHGPGGLAWLVTWDPAVADRVCAEIAAQVAASPRRADIEATFAEGGYAVLVDDPQQAVAVANAIAPEHLELLCDDAGSLALSVRHAGAVFCGPWAPASVGDYVAGPSHVLPTDGSARFGSALTVRDFQKDVHVVTLDRDALLKVAPHVEALATAEGLFAHADSVRRRRERPGVSAPIAPRGEIALMDGYHSPQVDVAVRLNTNEAPVPPPDAFREQLAAELAALDWHRYPDRLAAGLRAAIGELHGVGPEQVFAANGSNEVLQTLSLTYGGAGRVAAVFEPTYALHSHISRITGTTVATGERAHDFSLDMAEVHRVLTTDRPHITYLCSPNNPTGMVDAEHDVREVLASAPGLVVVDEAYGQFAPWSALDLVADDVPLVVTRTFSKTWSMAAARLGYLVGPAWLVAELEKVVLPYHLDAAKQVAGIVALRFRAEMEARVAQLVEERGRLVAALAELPVDVWPSGANFVLFRPRGRDGAAVWQQLLDHEVLVRNCASWPRLEGCLRVTIGTADEDDRFLDALREALT